MSYFEPVILSDSLALYGTAIGLKDVVFNFLDYYPAGKDSFADLGTELQQWLLWCQQQRKPLKGYTADDDQLLRNTVTAYLPAGIYDTTVPIIVPEFVNFKADGAIQRRGDLGGTITNFYTGDTTTKALANLYQPTVITAVNGHCERLEIMCNPDNVHAGSGFLAGKSWYVIGVAVAGPGTGYQVGDVLVGVNPSLLPYQPFQVTVSSVNGSGGITGANLTYYGTYSLPPALQVYQWTVANGYTGIFDPAHSGAYLVTGGNGTGASFTPTWQPDWSSGNPVYNAGLGSIGGNVIGDTILGNIKAQDVGTSYSSTYGSTFGAWINSLNVFFTEITTNGGDVGIMLQNCTDVHGLFANPVNANTLMKIFAGSSIEIANVVLDTPAASYIDIDECTSVTLPSVRCITSASSPTLTSGYGARIGSSSSGYNVVGLDIAIDMAGCGTTAGVPALYVANTKGSKINGNISNYTAGGSAATYKFSGFCAFGSNVDASNNITGSIDGVTGSIFAGAIPPCGIRVWDTVGTALTGGRYEISGSGAPVNGTTGLNKAGVGSLYIDVGAGAPYINQGPASSPAWSLISGGGITRSVNAISATTTGGVAAFTDYVYYCTGTFTFTLPTAVSNKNSYKVKNVGTGIITVNTTFGQTIDGAANLVLRNQNQANEFLSDNANWNIFS